MPIYVNTFFEERVEQLFNLADIVEKIFATAGLEYRLVGGLAVYLYVEEAAPDAGRLTKDIDIAIRREDLERIVKAAESFGFEYRHVAGVDMLIQSGEAARRSIHLVFAGERVRPEYPQPVPTLAQPQVIRGLRLIPLQALVHMKLTSFRLKDQVHLKDLDEAGLITPQIESSLPSELQNRLTHLRELE